jgi:lysophospholipase L1-like esterase
LAVSSSQSERGSRRPLAARLGLGLAATVFAVGLSDGALRWVDGRGLLDRLDEPPTLAELPPFKPTRDHTILGYDLEPGWQGRQVTLDSDVEVTINSLGLRDDELPQQKAPDVWRLVVLGDSFSFGWGVERGEGYCDLLEQGLARGQQRVQVINAGVPGWGPVQEWLWLLHQGHSFAPDAVLWQLSTNDVDELAMNGVELGPDLLPLSMTRDGLLRDSEFDRIATRLERLGIDPEQAFEDARAGRASPTVRKTLRTVLEKRADDDGEAPALIEDWDPDALEVALGHEAALRVQYLLHLVSTLRTACEQQGMALRVVLAGREGSGAEESPGSPRRALAAALSVLGAEAFDATALLAAHDDPDDYFRHDRVHWSPQGHRLVAEALVAWLADDPALGLERGDSW